MRLQTLGADKFHPLILASDSKHEVHCPVEMKVLSSLAQRIDTFKITVVFHNLCSQQH
jgi:hypothetical protein